MVDEVSKYVAKKAGLSLEDFAAVLRNPQQMINSNIADKTGYFATVTSQILRRLGEEYVKLANSLENDITDDDKLSKSRFRIAVFGKSRCGKTRLIHRLSNDWKILTEIFTGINQEDRNQKLIPQERVILNHYWLQTQDLELIDTPGYILNDNDTSILIDILNKCDGSVLVIAALSPLMIQEVAILEQMFRHSPHIIVAISKLDIVHPKERVKVFTRICEQIAEISKKIPVLPLQPIDDNTSESEVLEVFKNQLKTIVSKIEKHKTGEDELLSEQAIDYTQVSETREFAFAHNPEFRFPVLLLLDISGSLSGQPINQLNQGLVAFQQELNKDNLVSERVEVAIITFNSSVKVVQNFVTVNQFKPPYLSATGATAMGKAIETGLSLIEAQKATYKNNNIGYYRPWILLITDGSPTDSWQNAAKMIREFDANEKVNFFAVGFQGADMNFLKQISLADTPPLMLRELAFVQLFQWLSNSISVVSRCRPGDQVTFPPTSVWAKDNEALDNTLPITNNKQLVEQVNNQHDRVKHRYYDERSIRIIGDRGAGKTTFMAALASLSRTDSEIPFQVFPQNSESRTLLYDTENILRQGLSLTPTDVRILEELPFYSFKILLKPSLFIQPLAAIRGQTIEIDISFKEYPGELFVDLRNNRQDRKLYGDYLDDCATVSKLLFLIDGNTRDDEGYTESFMRLSAEINQRLHNNKEILSQYRIAVVISKCEEVLLWDYRYKAEKLMSLKFPRTQIYFQRWSQSWGCRIAYFACSSFGVMGKPPRPNFTFIGTDERGTHGVIYSPAQWKPFGLLAPIYWLHTGKKDSRLQQ